MLFPLIFYAGKHSFKRLVSTVFVVTLYHIVTVEILFYRNANISVIITSRTLKNWIIALPYLEFCQFYMVVAGIFLSDPKALFQALLICFVKYGIVKTWGECAAVFFTKF